VGSPTVHADRESEGVAMREQRHEGEIIVVLGIDPGTASTGWGVIENQGNKLRSLGHGCIVTSARTETPLRLRQIHDEILSLIDRFHPAVVALEELFVNVNVKTAMAVGHARGAIILAAGERDLPCFDYTPLAVKQAVTGYGRANKVQVQEMTKVLLSLPRIVQPDHASDALAVAITHIHASALLRQLNAR
jgi:crossover junction endodeoxyribonuclease RuvC